MRSIFLKDMAYRKARVVLTTLGVTVLVMLILILGGIMNGLRFQAQHYVKSTGADIWISKERSGGAFVGFSLLNPEYLAFIQREKGIIRESYSPLIFAQARPVIHGKETKAVVVGYKIGKLGGPKDQFELSEGRLFISSKYEDYRPEDKPPLEVIVDEYTELEIGEKIELGGKQLKVVGKVKGFSFVFDTPLLFMDLRTAQDAVLDNIIYVNTFIAKVAPGFSPTEMARKLDELSSVEVRTQSETIETILKNFVTEPMKGVQFLRGMLWLAAGIIVSMITYVTTLEKTREIGVMKAIGAPNRYVISLALKQVIVMAISGLTAGIILAVGAVPLFPIFVLLNFKEALLVVVITFGVCGIGGLLAARRAVSVDPMIAFREQ